jgi:hypothetical protein
VLVGEETLTEWFSHSGTTKQSPHVIVGSEYSNRHGPNLPWVCWISLVARDQTLPYPSGGQTVTFRECVKVYRAAITIYVEGCSLVGNAKQMLTNPETWGRDYLEL